MKEFKMGWLFGLSNGDVDEIEVGLFKIRRMSGTEREFVIRNSLVFFGSSEKIENTLARFPYVFEKEIIKNNSESLGSLDSIVLLLNILSSGEVKAPFQWSENVNGQGSSWSTEIYLLFFRSINSHFKEIPVETIIEPLKKIGHILSDKLNVNDLSENIDPWLKNRLLVSKNYPLNINFGNDFGIPVFITRTVEISSALEFLFQENTNADISFRLPLNVAWLLGNSTDERKQIFDAVRDTYNVRSKNVHGDPKNKPGHNEKSFKNVELSDYCLRRSILIKATNKFDKKTWIEYFSNARFGADLSGMDRFEWISK
ncbi:MAG: hypothetical protein WC843_03090 [Candidatus Gracilibacteria bacterium]|jgi:hypothetical protein